MPTSSCPTSPASAWRGQVRIGHTGCLSWRAEVFAGLRGGAEQDGGQSQASDPPSLPRAVADQRHHPGSRDERQARGGGGGIVPRDGSEQKREDQERQRSSVRSELDPDLKSGVV